MIAIWVGGTAMAMLLATLAVQVAGAKVTQRPAATVSRSQIDAEIARRGPASSGDGTGAGSVGPSAAGPATDPPASGGDVAVGGDPATTADPGGAAAPSTAAPSVSSPGKPTTPVTSTSAGPSGKASTTATQPSAATTTPAPTTASTRAAPSPSPTTSPPTTAASVTEQTFVLTGGSVRVRCTGAAAQRLSSNPASGYTMDIRSSGPQQVEVRFDGAEHRSELKASCTGGGTIVAEPRETAQGGGGADGAAHLDG